MEQHEIIDSPMGGDKADYVEYMVGAPTRFANFIIDVVGYYMFAIAIGAVIGLVFASSDPDTLSGFAETLDDPLWSRLFGVAVMFVYYFVFELTTGRSLGKIITGTKVISMKGEPLTPGQIAVRNLCRLVPFEAFSFLGGGAGWHDKWSKTLVVRKSFPGQSAGPVEDY